MGAWIAKWSSHSTFEHWYIAPWAASSSLGDIKLFFGPKHNIYALFIILFDLILLFVCLFCHVNCEAENWKLKKKLTTKDTWLVFWFKTICHASYTWLDLVSPKIGDQLSPLGHFNLALLLAGVIKLIAPSSCTHLLPTSDCAIEIFQLHRIDSVSILVFWSHLVNKLEPWHIVYIMQQ